jgi:hypothetical protein
MVMKTSKKNKSTKVIFVLMFCIVMCLFYFCSGAGIQVRTIDCLTSSDVISLDSLCTLPKPATLRSCTLGACSWLQPAFGACSEPWYPKMKTSKQTNPK